MKKLTRPLNICSWNVMSWNTLVDKIGSSTGSVGCWLDRHKIDILCIQEAKVNRQEFLLNTKYLIPGFSVYAAPNNLPGKGSNGVATIIRILSAPEVTGIDFSPIGDSDYQAYPILKPKPSRRSVNLIQSSRFKFFHLKNIQLYNSRKALALEWT